MNSLRGKKVLITGGLGFIGSNLALRLKNLRADVTLLCRNLEKKYRLSPYENDFNILKGDITNTEFVGESIKNMEIIFHLAAQTSHSYSLKEPLKDSEVNIGGTLNVLDSIRKYNSKAKLVFTSTKGVTGIPKSLPVNEETPSNPLDFYSLNKLAAEEYCNIYRRLFDIDYTIIRLTNVFGPRQQINSPSLGILNFFIGQAMKNQTLTIYGEGNQLRDYNYIDNTIDALILCATKSKAKGELFYLGTNIGTKFKDMANTILEIVGKGEITYVPYPSEASKIEIGDFIVDYTKLNKQLGWYPKINFREGIEKTVEFYSRNSKYFET